MIFNFILFNRSYFTSLSSFSILESLSYPHIKCMRIHKLEIGLTKKTSTKPFSLFEPHTHTHTQPHTLLQIVSSTHFFVKRLVSVGQSNFLYTLFQLTINYSTSPLDSYLSLSLSQSDSPICFHFTWCVVVRSSEPFFSLKTYFNITNSITVSPTVNFWGFK